MKQVKQTNKKPDPTSRLEVYAKEGGPGRPKGSKNKYTNLKKALLEAFERTGGIDGLVDWVQFSYYNRERFYTLLFRLLPKNTDDKESHD